MSPPTERVLLLRHRPSIGKFSCDKGLLWHLSQNGEWEIRIPFAISRVGTKLDPLNAAEEPDESKEKTEREQGDSRDDREFSSNVSNVHRPPHDAGILLPTRIVVGCIIDCVIARALPVAI